MLATGDVLAAGGSGASGTALATAERFDPSTGGWGPAGSMASARTEVAATTLSDGDVLVVGDATDAQLYDPATATWSSSPNMAATREMASLAVLPDGDVLVAGGLVGTGASTGSAVLYDTGSDTWKSAGTMRTSRAGASVAVLSNGQVLAVGGVAATPRIDGAPSLTPLSTVAIYTPPAMVTARVSGTPTPASGEPHSGEPHSGQPHSVEPKGAGPHVAKPHGAPVFSTVPSSSSLAIVLGSAGGALLVLAAIGVAVFLRRRRLGVVSNGPQEE